MGHLMCNDIVEHPLRCEDQPPREGERTGSGAASSSRLSVAHRDTGYHSFEGGGQAARTCPEFMAREPDQRVPDTAAEMRRLAANGDRAVGDRDAAAPARPEVTNSMHYTEDRNLGAVVERDPGRLLSEAAAHPSALL